MSYTLTSTGTHESNVAARTVNPFTCEEVSYFSLVTAEAELREACAFLVRAGTRAPRKKRWSVSLSDGRTNEVEEGSTKKGEATVWRVTFPSLPRPTRWDAPSTRSERAPWRRSKGG